MNSNSRKNNTRLILSLESRGEILIDFETMNISDTIGYILIFLSDIKEVGHILSEIILHADRSIDQKRKHYLNFISF